MSDSPTMLAPTATLFAAPQRPPSNVTEGSIGVVGMPSDWTHSSRIGTRFGPDALRVASSEIVERLPLSVDGDFIDPVDGSLWRLNSPGWMYDCGDAEISPSSVERTTAAICEMTRAVRCAGATPVALGGDHYNSYPACLGYAKGLADLHPGRRFGYIQVDGHLDFSDRLGAWGTHNHATNARRIFEIPNLIQENMVWIGITGWVDGGDLEQIEEMGGKVFSSGDVQRLGPRKVTELAVAHATRGCESVYLSIDIDAMDAGFLPGTGSIVHSGMTPRQYCQILDVLAEAPIDGLDIVEVSPPLDPSGRTQRIAAHMLMRVLKRRMFKQIKSELA